MSIFPPSGSPLHYRTYLTPEPEQLLNQIPELLDIAGDCYSSFLKGAVGAIICRNSRCFHELLHCPSTVGVEELGHLEMVGTIVYQLTRDLNEEQIKTAGFDTYFVDHTAGVYPQFASGTPWTAATMQVKGDLIADLTEDLAAEQKARVTYDNILRLSDDPDVNDVIKFLRAREIVHFQRFGETNQSR